MSAIGLSKKLKKASSNLIILNLAIAHFFVSSIVSSFTLVGVFGGEDFFRKFPALCKLTSTIYFLTHITALENEALLAIDR